MPPRSGLSPAARKALAYWGVIELAAETGATTRDMWEWIHQHAETLNLASPGVTVQGVSELRGRAGRIQEAGRQFAKLRDDQRVRGPHVADPPWQRTPAERKALPKFAVRFQHTYLRGDEAVTEWRTSVFYGQINHTAGQLRRDVELDAINLANKYNTEHLDVANLQVLRI